MKTQKRPLIERVQEEIAKNGGQVDHLIASQIASQIEKGTVPNTMICIVTGKPVAVSNKALRAKRLASAEGKTLEEKLFRLLTGYKSMAVREKKEAEGPKYRYKAHKAHVPADQAISVVINGKRQTMSDGTIFTGANEEGKVERIVVANGTIAKIDIFENGKPEDFVGV